MPEACTGSPEEERESEFRLRAVGREHFGLRWDRGRPLSHPQGGELAERPPSHSPHRSTAKRRSQTVLQHRAELGPASPASAMEQRVLSSVAASSSAAARPSRTQGHAHPAPVARPRPVARAGRGGRGGSVAVSASITPPIHVAFHAEVARRGLDSELATTSEPPQQQQQQHHAGHKENCKVRRRRERWSTSPASAR